MVPLSIIDACAAGQVHDAGIGGQAPADLALSGPRSIDGQLQVLRAVETDDDLVSALARANPDADCDIGIVRQAIVDTGDSDVVVDPVKVQTAILDPLRPDRTVTQVTVRRVAR